MALTDLSFKFFTDTGLTTAFSNLYQLVHNTDLSDNPQDFVLYFGSAATADAYKLQASSNPGVDDITITPTDTLAVWEASTAYIVGDRIQPTVSDTFVYECTTAGTSHSSEPTFPAVITNTVADNTVVWTCMSKQHVITEIKLATTSGGLAGATAGAALALGNTITSGTANYVEVNIRFTNSVTTVGSNTGYPELGLYINNVQEDAA